MTCTDSAESPANRRLPLPACEVNRRLLPVKGFYFFFHSASSCLWPYIPVYIRHLGVPAYQAGLISGAQPFAGFLFKPILGFVADRLDKHKQVLLVSIFLCLTFLFCSYFVPPVQTSTLMSNDEFNCTPYTLETISLPTTLRKTCVLGQNVPGTLDIPSCNSSKYMSGANHFTADNITEQITCLSSAELAVNLTGLYMCCPRNETLTDGCSVCQCTEATCDSTQEGDSEIGGGWTLTFWLLFLLLVPGLSIHASVLTQSDAYTMQTLGEEKTEGYGRQRLWGSIGWGIFATVSGFSTDLLGDENGQSNYDFAFYSFAAFGMVTLLLVGFTFKSWNQSEQHNMAHHIRQLICKKNVIVFLSVLFVLGSSFGVLETFAFWFLKDLGGSQLLLGLCLTVNCIAEVPFFFFSGKLIEKISHKGVFTVALFFFALRFLLLSLLVDPWWAIPVEVLHGTTYGAMFAASTTYASQIAPPGMEATMQGVMGAVFMGVGWASGSLIGGALFDRYGGVVLFRVYAGVCLFTCVVYTVVSRWIKEDLGVDTKELVEGAPAMEKPAADQGGIDGPCGDVERVTSV
ncbi:PREDICTED: major facilitator superfamily domain-containing protein 6-like [Branchiostoma belcheri]|uniref:Major facilitator superfamily domain-containing protein 6-like n=1 Tax=Branchiostoma belcheri TaxID=7741 RepID=A0A6P5AFJ0_BRABE|nr:PREDICTED: major facilitator superfamily domain-containing protein 6-like [Branchiostoma belcheri]